MKNSGNVLMKLTYLNSVCNGSWKSNSAMIVESTIKFFASVSFRMSTKGLRKIFEKIGLLSFQIGSRVSQPREERRPSKKTHGKTRGEGEGKGSDVTVASATGG